MLNSDFKNRIHIYSDGADKNSFIELGKNPLVKGFTTNPSLMKKAGVVDYKSYSLEIIQLVPDKPLSFEVFADDISEMRRQAQDIKTWGQNVFVKIPIMNTKKESTLKLVKELAQDGVKLNITALLTYEQAIDTIQAVKGGAPSIVSIFAGRIADTGRNPMPIMRAASDYARELDANISVLWASTREAYNIVQAEECGCHIITAPPDLVKKATQFGKSLFEVSLDTVKTFKADSDAAGFKL